ncbi:hypothetical protein [Streptomyces yerevanensis]|uniref:hypothetical protein n=1 Tax=Streptomyces yerevanensis TaxID=66378 RepID=UPI00052544E2|nr:hypothetical protein [Streptomyces yerevanensis]
MCATVAAVAMAALGLAAPQASAASEAAAATVYVSSFACAPVTAKMGQTSSSLYIDYKSSRVFPCG